MWIAILGGVAISSATEMPDDAQPQIIDEQQRRKDRPPLWETLDPWAQRAITNAVSGAIVSVTGVATIGAPPTVALTGIYSAIGASALLGATDTDARAAKAVVNTVGRVAREVIATREDAVRITDRGRNTAGGLAGCTLTQFRGRRC